MKNILALKNNVPIFKELEESELKPIDEIAKTHLYKQKVMLFMQEEPLDKVFFILEGKVKIYKTDASGKEQLVNIVQDGEMFPHAGFFRRGCYPAHAEVMEDSRITSINIRDFERILLLNPDISMKIFRVMGEKIIDLQERLEEQILLGTYERIIKLLLRLGKTNGQVIENGDTIITTHFTNRELANMIGSTRETVSRTLNQLKKKQYIHFNENGLMHIISEKLETEVW